MCVNILRKSRLALWTLDAAVAAATGIDHGDAKAGPPIAMPTAQPVLKIIHKQIRSYAV
jgi:hypothetical protein